jgi:L-amino acid N-acyltransferase YncA
MDRIRAATEPDVASITAIYNDAVRNSTGTFDTEPRTVADRTEWFRVHDDRHPILVSERDGTVVGWGAVSAWSERPAYGATGEVSVYVAAPFRGQGVGRRLLEALLESAARRQYHTLLARIAEGNGASLRLHTGAGFTSIGVMRQVGWKFGRRLDVHLLQWMAPPKADGEAGPPTPG